MPAELLLVPILLPILCGAVLGFKGWGTVRARNAFVLAAASVNTLAVWTLILFDSGESLTLFYLVGDLELGLRLDGLGKIFAGLVATLWPLTTLYAFEYLGGKAQGTSFYAFFLLAYGVTVGIAASGNILTMYCFYEMLSLVTVPLIAYTRTKAAIRASRMYLAYSVGGAAFAFVGIVYMLSGGVFDSFVFGGAGLSGGWRQSGVYQLIYLLIFLGFGVKAAVFPLHGWLPRAAVAPTPVTALLHAVAVVKAGVFAITRLTWYSFGPDFLAGSWAQKVVICLSLFTILFGSAMALKQRHWKLRLAYSTVSNLSYIVFGVVLLTPEGLAGGILHMLFHGVIKILAFFCAGAVLHYTGREYQGDLNGLGKRLPLVFACFTVSALALTGIPPLNGFVSKWSLLTAAASQGTALGLAGGVVILVSALLTAMYMLTTVVRAFFNTPAERLPEATGRPGVCMCIPLTVLAAGCLALGVFAGPFASLAAKIAAGLF